MPTLPLTFPAQGVLAQLNHARVAATMLWPSPADEKDREDGVDAIGKQMVINFARANPYLPMGPDGAEALEWLRNGPPSAEITKRAKRRYYEGILVGHIVLVALSHHQKTGEPLQLKDIKQNVLKHYRSLRLSSPEQRNFDNQIWPRMKPVAHFWAAHIRLGLGREGVIPKFPCPVDELPEFLIDAGKLLAETAQTKLRRSRDRLLNPDDAWTIHT